MDLISIPSRTQTLKTFKDGGGQIAAVLPIHYSRSLLRAFNILPVEVWGPPRVASGQAAAHLQTYVCSICHNVLSFLQQGGLDVADLIIVPHACDSLQGLGSVLLDYIKPTQPVIPVYIPRDKRQSDLEFLAAEFKAIYEQLVEITGREPGEVDLSASIDREEKADDYLLKLHQRNRFIPLTNADIYQIIRSREYLPAEEFIRIADGALAQQQETIRSGIPILIEGIVPEPMDILETLTELGAAVVGDDLASSGRRVYPRSNRGNPFERMAERILQAPPDPTRGSPLSERLDYLLNMAQRTGAKGVVFYIVKFCEPELFDIPILRQELKAFGLATIAIEVDLNTRLSQQIRTRLGAFLEMIQ
jgi:benzoyl-CoA reductase/2-hydroxyglutaryl-CoA dehydratase subunit BcrC/BadD/HgdB